MVSLASAAGWTSGAWKIANVVIPSAVTGRVCFCVLLSGALFLERKRSGMQMMQMLAQMQMQMQMQMHMQMQMQRR